MYFLLSLTYFGNAIATNQLQQFFFFHPISVMPLPQIHSHKFFFFPSISAMVLPKTNWNKFFSLLFQQCHCHNSISLYFVIEECDKPNCFSKKKKNTERIRICVLFFISLIYFGDAIATNNKFFFYYVFFFVFVHNTSE